jgi:hypothetical protein
MDAPRTDGLIARNHVLIAAATKARSDIRATILKAEQRRERARITGTVLNLPIAIFQSWLTDWRSVRPFCNGNIQTRRALRQGLDQ